MLDAKQSEELARAWKIALATMIDDIEASSITKYLSTKRTLILGGSREAQFICEAAILDALTRAMQLDHEMKNSHTPRGPYRS